jgi:Co/Zn/Cd efflux system component
MRRDRELVIRLYARYGADSAILLDMNPDQHMCAKVRAAIEGDGDELADPHIWRLGPGHLGAVLPVITGEPRDCRFYRARLGHLKNLSMANC